MGWSVECREGPPKTESIPKNSIIFRWKWVTSAWWLLVFFIIVHSDALFKQNSNTILRRVHAVVPLLQLTPMAAVYSHRLQEMKDGVCMIICQRYLQWINNNTNQEDFSDALAAKLIQHSFLWPVNNRHVIDRQQYISFSETNHKYFSLIAFQIHFTDQQQKMIQQTEMHAIIYE